MKYSKMPTSLGAKRSPVHDWYSFVAGYSPEYIEYVVEEYSSRVGEAPRRIYDPFAGCATTNVTANSLGIASLGVERNPIFYNIGKAKCDASKIYVYFNEIIDRFSAIYSSGVFASIEECLSSDAEAFLSKLFNREDLEYLLALRREVNLYKNLKWEAGYLLLTRLLEYVTFAKTDGIYKAPGSKKHNLGVEEAIETLRLKMLGNVQLYSSFDCQAKYVFDSSITYQPEEGAFDLVVFSPPYLNNFDFAEMTRMQMYFWGEAGSWREISDRHRNLMLVNTTTALKNVRDDSIQMAMREGLPSSVQNDIDTIINKLNRLRFDRPRNKRYDFIIYPYLSQMQSVLEHCYSALSDSGEIRIVLSDAAFYGIHIETEKYISQIMESIGFQAVDVFRMRNRGDRWVLKKRRQSDKQLGEYEIKALRR